MSLEEKINNDIKASMLAKDRDRLEALRGIKAAILLLKTEKSASAEVTPDAEIKLLQKLHKQRKESGEIYRTSGRDDLAKVEFFQAEVIGQYLPNQMSPEEVEAIVKRIISETGATNIKDMGKVMGIATKELAGKADNKTVSELVKKTLGV
jgi:uncharacterized protein YqeY